MQRLMIIIQQENNIINGNLYTLEWVVLKSSMVMGDTYDESLARLNIIESEDKY